MSIHTKLITSPTKKSAAAKELRNRLEIVLNVLFLTINHKTSAFPIMAARPVRPYNVDKTILPVTLNSLLLQQVLKLFMVLFPVRCLAVKVLFLFFARLSFVYVYQ